MVPFASIRKLSRLLEHIPFMAVQCKLAAVHLDHWPQKAIDVMKEFCPPEHISTAVFRPRKSDNVLEVESLFVGDNNIVELVLANLACPRHLDATSSSETSVLRPVSPSDESHYIPAPQVDSYICLIQVEAKLDADSMETGPECSEQPGFLPIE